MFSSIQKIKCQKRGQRWPKAQKTNTLLASDPLCSIRFVSQWRASTLIDRYAINRALKFLYPLVFAKTASRFLTKIPAKIPAIFSHQIRDTF